MFSDAKNFALKLGRPIYRALCRQYKHELVESNAALIRQAANCMSVHEGANDLSCIIFSMDRAMQLHALLGSYGDLVVNGPKVTIVYRVSNERHRNSYKGVFAEFSDLIREVVLQETRTEFKTIVIDVLSRTQERNVFFLVDDNMFIEPVDVSELSVHASTFAVPTLRLGENLERSYTVQKSQQTPSLMRHVVSSDIYDSPIDMLSWVWGSGELDWGYPLSVDGHIFQRNEILAIAKAIDFDSPNTFEGTLQKFNFAFQWRLGVCYRKSKLINIPYNRVQSDFENIHGEIHQDEMLKMWEDGYRIDRTSYYGFVNESAHQELPLRLRKAESK